MSASKALSVANVTSGGTTTPAITCVGSKNHRNAGTDGPLTTSARSAFCRIPLRLSRSSTPITNRWWKTLESGPGSNRCLQAALSVQSNRGQSWTLRHPPLTCGRSKNQSNAGRMDFLTHPAPRMFAIPLVIIVVNTITIRAVARH